MSSDRKLLDPIKMIRALSGERWITPVIVAFSPSFSFAATSPGLLMAPGLGAGSAGWASLASGDGLPAK